MAAVPYAPEDSSPLRPDHAYRGLPPGVARVFRLLAAHPGSDMSAETVAALVDLSADDVEEALRRLATARLLAAVSDGGERWQVSPDARHYAQQLSDELAEVDGREEALDRLIDYYLMTTEAADERLRGLPPVIAVTEFTDRSGALAWLDAEWRCLVATVRMAATIGRDEAAKRFPLLMAQYLGFRGLLDELVAVTSLCLEAARRMGDQTAEGEALTNLGLAWYGLGQFPEAVQAHREALNVFREIANRQGEGATLNNLGLALHGLGQNDDAVAVHEEAAAIFRETGDRQGEGRALNNLGLALHGIAQNDDALRAHREAAAIFHATGYAHDEANALANLGNALNLAELYDEARAAYRKAADIFGETGDHRAELMARQSLQLIREMS